MPPPDEAHDKAPDDGVTRVKIQKPYWGWSAPIGMFCVIANVVAASVIRQQQIFLLASSFKQYVLIVVCVLATSSPFLAVYQMILIRRKRHLKSIQTRINDENMGGVVDRVFHNITVSELRVRLPSFAKLISSGDKTYAAVVIHWDEVVPPVQPVQLAFEPQLLETPDTFLDDPEPPASSAANLDFGSRSTDATDIQGSGENTRLRRTIKFVGFGFVLVSGFWVVAQIAISAQHRWVTSLLLPFTIFVLATIAMWGLLGLKYRDRWLVAPGAVVLRRNRGMGSDVQLVMFDRRHAVLCAIELPIDGWAITFLSETDSAYRNVTSTQLKRILRAWLSPISPPVTRLVDFE